MAADEKFEQQKLINTQAFQYLFEVEILLRELCANKLEDLYGRNVVSFRKFRS
jgi:hypothetical protein